MKTGCCKLEPFKAVSGSSRGGKVNAYTEESGMKLATNLFSSNFYNVTITTTTSKNAVVFLEGMEVVVAVIFRHSF